MDLRLNNTIFDEFKALTNYDVRNTIDLFLAFVEDDYPSIVSLFKGDIKNNFSEAFDNLKIIRIEVDSFFQTVKLFKNQLVSYKWWILIDEFERIDSTVLIIQNVSKWLKMHQNASKCFKMFKNVSKCFKML